jgi:hypothetical protein
VRRTALLLLPALAAASLTATGPATGSVATARPASAAERAVSTSSTPFALSARGFGSRVEGEQVPVSSSTTGFTGLGCTNETGRTERNHVAEVEVPGLGTLSGVATRVTTREHDGAVASVSRHGIAGLVIAQDGLGSVAINGLASRARAWHDADGFHADTLTEIGSITFTPPGMPPQEMPLPTPDQPLEIPGLVTIEAARSAKDVTDAGAMAKAMVLKITVVPTGTTARIAFSNARIHRGIKSGLFRGAASGVQGTGLDGMLSVGQLPLSLLPCQGTGGEVVSKSLASVDLADQVVVGAVSSSQRAWQTRRKAVAWMQGDAASIDLGGGALHVEGIVGRVKVTKVGRHVRYSTAGTTIGEVVANGEPQTFPDTGVLEIPGVARLEPGVVVENGRRDVKVIGLRITLLDGTGAVIDLGNAKVGVRDPS